MRDTIMQKFEQEFEFLKDRFVFIEEQLSTIKNSKTRFIHHPGVYVYHNGTDVIKVGRHLTNSRKRALEHISSNTKNEVLEMKDLVNRPETKIVLINIKEVKDRHWVAALEMYMEDALDPIIKSKRH